MDRSKSKNLALIKFLLGLVFLAGCLVMCVAGWIPAEEVAVVGHNLETKLDATPLFYSDSDDMTRLQEGLDKVLNRDSIQ